MSFFFLNPLFLTAFACVGIPLLLHLLMRQKPQKLTFPALRFLQMKERTCRRSFQLRNWLLLLVRMLLTALLVLLFARPGIQFTKNGSPNVKTAAEYSSKPTAAIFLIDTSVRMEYVFENRSRLEEAQEQALQIMAGLPSRSSAAVVSTSLAAPAFSPDKGEIQRQIQQLKTAPSSQTIPEKFPEILKLLKTSALEQQELFIFTDCTNQSWSLHGHSQRKKFEDTLNDLQKEFPNLRISLIDVGIEAAANARLDIPDETSFQMVPGGAMEVHSRILSTTGKSHRVGIFVLDETGHPQLLEEKEISPLNPASLTNSSDKISEVSLPVTFQLGRLKTGSNQGFLAFLDDDALSADNARGFTIEKAPPTPVLLVANDPAEKNAFFVRQALTPAQFAFENRAGFECSTLSFSQFSAWILGTGNSSAPSTSGKEILSENSIENLAYRSGTLERFHAIFFLDPPGFSSLEWKRLGEYVNSGGGVAFFLGPSLKDSQNFQLAEARQFLPAIPGFQARFRNGTVLNPRFAVTHPILQIFRNLDTPIPWEDSSVFRSWTLEEPAQDTQILFEWGNHSPALLSKTIGNGRVVLAGTPVNTLPSDSRTLWNLLPQGNSWVFLVLMNAVAEYLSEESETSVNIFTHETLSFPLRGTESERFFLCFNPFSLPGNQYSVSKNPSADEIVLIPDLEHNRLDVPALEQSGNYLLSDSRQRENSSRVSNFLRGFSVNLPLELTDLKRLSHEEIQQFFHSHSIIFLENIQLLKRTISGTQSANDLFNWIATLILLLFLLENWLSNRFYRTS